MVFKETERTDGKPGTVETISRHRPRSSPPGLSGYSSLTDDQRFSDILERENERLRAIIRSQAKQLQVYKTAIEQKEI